LGIISCQNIILYIITNVIPVYILIIVIMNDIQILQLFGLSLLAISISTVLDRGMLKKLFLSFADSLSVLFLTGLLTLVLGYLIILTHKNWGGLIHNFVLIIWYLSLIKGLFLLVFPGLTMNLLKSMSNKNCSTNFFSILIFVFSLLCLYAGFIPMK